MLPGDTVLPSSTFVRLTVESGRFVSSGPPARWPRSSLMEPIIRMAFYADVAGRHPDVAVIVPPRSRAVMSDNAAMAPTQRDRHLPCITENGRMAGAADPATRPLLPTNQPAARPRFKTTAGSETESCDYSDCWVADKRSQNRCQRLTRPSIPFFQTRRSLANCSERLPPLRR
jgi:hypothetical protein